METIHPRYVVDEEGVARSVVLDISEFRSLLESAGAQAPGLTPAGVLQVKDLGWTCEEAAETRLRLRTFEEDWDAPGMDAYDRV